MRVVFMGTPDFAVPCLKVLFDKHHVVGVFTQPDKPKGRKMELTPPPVKTFALERGCNVFQPLDIKSQNAYEYLKFLKPDVIVVVAYGQILPKSILEMPKYGCINVHASLLPRHRGASPIQWSILSGDKVTGVTTMLMNEGLDTGDIIEKAELKCSLEDIKDAGELHDILSVMGGELIISTLNKLEFSMATFTKQNDSESNYAPILTKEMGIIDWSKTAREIDCQIRGLSPWPGTYTLLNGKKLKIFGIVPEEVHELDLNDAACGEIVFVDEHKFMVKTGDLPVSIPEVQLEGKKRMDTGSFLRGNKPVKGNILGG